MLFSDDVVLLLDEMYIQQEVQYDGRDLIGCDAELQMLKSILCFMVVSLKQSRPYIIKAMPLTKINHQIVQDGILSCISILNKAKFTIRAVVCDNHPSNVSAYKHLRFTYPCAIHHNAMTNPSNPEKYTSSSVPASPVRLVRFSPDHFWLCPIPFVLEYPNQPDHFSLWVRFNRTTPNLVAPTLLIFDTVHLMKNIRNNLLAKKFFQVTHLDVTVMDGVINIPPGTIRWSTFHCVHEKDLAIECHVKKHLRYHTKFCIQEIISNQFLLLWQFSIHQPSLLLVSTSQKKKQLIHSSIKYTPGGCL